VLRFISLYLVSFCLYAGACSTDNCMIVIDAGSSGSRLHVYSFLRDMTLSPEHIKELVVNKVKPGISTVRGSQEEMDDYLTKLFKDVELYKDIPLYFNATAGMRLLPPKKQEKIYAKINFWLVANHYNIRQLKTITGTQEGLYGWLAVNYRMNRLKDTTKPTVGVMDMGGASVQLTFQALNKQQLSYDDVTTVTIYGNSYTLYDYSFLGLGEDEVTHQLVNNQFCFPQSYDLPSGQMGSGSISKCNRTAALLMNKIHHVNKKVAHVIKDNLVTTWVAMGGISYLLEKKPFHFSSHQFNPLEMINQANEEVCKKQWGELAQKYPDNDYLYGYCLFAAYYHALIVNGYGIGENQIIDYVDSSDDNDWTIGVVLKNA
jgi:Golgi nucleoside diphosphatase